MKYLYSILICLAMSAAFCQPAKDSLLSKDINHVTEQIKLMHYLNDAMFTRAVMSDESIKREDKYFNTYFNDTLVANNPVPTLSITSFLGYDNNVKPKSWEEFIDVTATQNAKALISIIDKYGYPSLNRLKKYSGASQEISLTTIIDRAPPKLKDKFRPLIKKEYKLGNMSESEYEFCRFFLRKSNKPTDFIEFQKRMAKLNAKMYTP